LNTNNKDKKSIKCEDFVKIFENMSNFSHSNEKDNKNKQKEILEQRENQIKMTEQVYETLTF
jgi:esterase/lipase